MNTHSKLSRRGFLKASALAGVGLTLGFYIPPDEKKALALQQPLPQPLMNGNEFAPNAYLRIAPDNTITVFVAYSEMGQGVRTSLPMILAEELDADWSKIKIEQAPADYAYGDQVTGGSASIQSSWGALRLAGARARSMIVAAAAKTWSVDATQIRTENSVVYGPKADQKLTYGDLVDLASTMPSENIPKLKDPKDFKIVGKRMPLVDVPDYVTGRAIYVSDVRVPGMLFAVVARCPVFGGKLKTYDATKAKAIPGVRNVVEIDAGIAVVAENTWAAMQGRDALEITWDEGKNAQLSTDVIHAQLKAEVEALLAKDEDTSGAVKQVEATYEQPYMAHVTMEGPASAADIKTDSGELWLAAQDRQAAHSLAGGLSGVSSDKLTFHYPLIGCGWGRRLNVTYTAEAAQVSKQIGAPVNLIWTRDDDIRHDYYRPMSYHVLRAGLDADGMPVSWRHYVASQGIGNGSSEIGTGANGLPYDVSARVFASHDHRGIPVGYWRSVFNTNNGYVDEAFMDELAAAAGKDPYEYRMAQLSDSSRMKPVLKLAAEKAGWGTPLPKGSGRGIACYATWGVTYVAQVAEVSVADDGAVTVHRVVCVVDCGIAVNPDTVESQLEGGIMCGINQAFKHEITVTNGRVDQKSFLDYPLLRIEDAPAIEVYIVPSKESPMGMGEMGNPPTPAAISNAIFAATGKRIRKLPIRKSDL